MANLLSIGAIYYIEQAKIASSKTLLKKLFVIFFARRRKSAPGGVDREDDEDQLMIYQDFTSVMKEVSKSLLQLKKLVYKMS